MFKKIAVFLFPALYKGFDFDAIDRDGDGLLQEGSQFERKITVEDKPVKKAAAKKKSAVKKATVKKAVVKKAPVKKAVKKAPAKKKIVAKKK
jgi:hypothetical protein